MSYNNIKHWYKVSGDKALIPLQQVLHTNIIIQSLLDENKPSNSGEIFGMSETEKVLNINKLDTDKIVNKMEIRQDIDIKVYYFNLYDYLC